jgi:hypothetical protein
MERDDFERRFREATEVALRAARTLVIEALPDEVRFRVRLNASYDGNPLHPDERVYPDDRKGAEARAASACTADDAVALWFRDGAVPEWIDLSVIGETGTETLVEAVTCGRFTANDALLYHAREGRPPFHSLGPAFPAGYDLRASPRPRFSLYEQSRVSSLDDLERAALHAPRVRILNLSGPVFDDASIDALPRFPNLTRLTLRETAVTPACVERFAKRHPGLIHPLTER